MLTKIKKTGPAAKKAPHDLENRPFGIFRQLWFLPFLWSLTWFLYWLLRDILLLHGSFLEGNLWNYMGIVLSLAALALTTKILPRTRQAPDAKHIAPKIQAKPTIDDAITEHSSVKSAPQSKQQQDDEPTRTEKASTCPKSKADLADCLTCPELVTCVRRNELFKQN